MVSIAKCMTIMTGTGFLAGTGITCLRRSKSDKQTLANKEKELRNTDKLSAKPDYTRIVAPGTVIDPLDVAMDSNIEYKLNSKNSDEDIIKQKLARGKEYLKKKTYVESLKTGVLSAIGTAIITGLTLLLRGH